MTEKEYWAGLELYAGHESCNRLLLAEMKAAFSALNVVYLKACLKKMPQIQTPQYDRKKAREEYKNPIEKPLIEESDKVLIGLSLRLQDLFTERNRLSNGFHRWGLSDRFKAQRAEISTQIELVQRQINRTLQDRDHYLNTGVAPDDAPPDASIPTDPYDRMRKFKNYAVQIANKKQDIKQFIKELVAQGFTEPQISADERMKKKLASLERLKKNQGVLRGVIDRDRVVGENVG
jgi:hypothetical protein